MSTNKKPVWPPPRLDLTNTPLVSRDIEISKLERVIDKAEIDLLNKNAKDWKQQYISEWGKHKQTQKEIAKLKRENAELLATISQLKESGVQLKAREAALIEALEKIANEDFRGNRPQGSVDAYRALEANRKARGNE